MLIIYNLIFSILSLFPYTPYFWLSATSLIRLASVFEKSNNLPICIVCLVEFILFIFIPITLSVTHLVAAYWLWGLTIKGKKLTLILVALWMFLGGASMILEVSIKFQIPNWLPFLWFFFNLILFFYILFRK